MFPLDLARRSIALTLETASASVESDRIRILNKMAGVANLNARAAPFGLESSTAASPTATVSSSCLCFFLSHFSLPCFCPYISASVSACSLCFTHCPCASHRSPRAALRIDTLSSAAPPTEADNYDILNAMLRARFAAAAILRSYSAGTTPNDIELQKQMMHALGTHEQGYNPWRHSAPCSSLLAPRT